MKYYSCYESSKDLQRYPTASANSLCLNIFHVNWIYGILELHWMYKDKVTTYLKLKNNNSDAGISHQYWEAFMWTCDVWVHTVYTFRTITDPTCPPCSTQPRLFKQSYQTHLAELVPFKNTFSSTDVFWSPVRVGTCAVGMRAEMLLENLRQDTQYYTGKERKWDNSGFDIK